MTTRESAAPAASVGIAGLGRPLPLGNAGFWKDALRRRILAAADLLAVFAAAGVAGALDGASAGFWFAASAPLWILLAKLRGLYDRDHVRVRHLTLDEASSLFHWAMLGGTATSLLLVALPGDVVSVQGALAAGLTAFVAGFGLRAGARALWRRLVPRERGLVVGSGSVAERFARRLALEPGHHLDIVAQLDLGPPASGGNGSSPSRANLDEWESIVRALDVERVIVALHDLDEATLAPLVAGCRALGVKLSVAPPMRAMLGTAVELNHLAELPLIEFRTWDPSRSTMLLKRAIDLVGSTAAIALLSPLLVAVAVAVRLDSPGSALYRQRRAGRDGVPFQILKFRTMVHDAEARVEEVVSLDDLRDPMFKVRADPRVTRVGRFLRRTSIDELPQLFNVLRGDMSLVGPRPEEVWLVERYAEADRFRLEMRPGLTGPMQVHGRGELTFQERMSVEREYVENYSLRKDLKILCRTIATVITGRGAF